MESPQANVSQNDLLGNGIGVEDEALATDAVDDGDDIAAPDEGDVAALQENTNVFDDDPIEDSS